MQHMKFSMECPACQCNFILELGYPKPYQHPRLPPAPPPAVQEWQVLVPKPEPLHAPQEQEQEQQPQQQPQQPPRVELSEAFGVIGQGLQCEKQKDFKTALAYYKLGTASAIPLLKQWPHHDPNLLWYYDKVRMAITRSEHMLAEQLADSPLQQAAQPQHQEQQPQQPQRQPEAAQRPQQEQQPQQPQRQPEAARRKPHQESSHSSRSASRRLHKQQPQQPQRQPEAAQHPHLEQQPQQPQRQPEAAQRLQL